jgi:CheY-like chemotaxis protein
MPTDLLPQPCPDATATAKRHKILIIEDDRATADVLSFRLAQQGFDTVLAARGKQGLAMASSECPALIVLDLRLPDMDGFTLCERLVDSPDTCGIPVIILSGMERPDIVRRSRAAGCHFFVRKPYDPNALLALIRQAIGECCGWDGT